MKKLFIMLLLIPFIQGCAIGLLAGGVGYGVGQGRKGSAKLIEAKAKYSENYNNYKLGMEKINLEREQSKLSPQPILDFETWLQQQPLTPEEIKMFKYYKGQTVKELTKK